MLMIAEVAIYHEGRSEGERDAVSDRCVEKDHTNKYMLTDITPVAPAACDENTISKAMRYPEELFDNPGNNDPNKLVQNRYQAERAQSTDVIRRKRRDDFRKHEARQRHVLFF
jgi:hypothetical protein